MKILSRIKLINTLSLLMGLVTSPFAPLLGQAIDPAAKAKAIICLSYDDALASHLSVVLPQLDSAGLKATFFLNSIQGSSDLLGQGSAAVLGWRKAAQQGHELANHTLFHPCPQDVGWQREIAIESYTTETLLEEIKAVNGMLRVLDGKRGLRSFAYPCNNLLVAEEDFSIRLKTSGLVKYARAGGDRSSVISDYSKLNPMQVPSWLVEEGTSVEELIEFAQKVKQKGGMGIYQFHGVGSEFFTISQQTHKQFLAYLKANQQYFRILTFSQAMDQLIAK